MSVNWNQQKPSGKYWSPTSQQQAQPPSSVVSDLTPSAPAWSPTSPTRSTSTGSDKKSGLGSPVKEFVPGKGLQEVQSEPVEYHDVQQAQHMYHQQMTNAMQNMHFVSMAEGEALAQAAANGYNAIPDPQLIDTPRLISQSCQPLPNRRTMESSMLPDNIRAYYAKQTKLCMDAAPPDDPRLKEVPRRFHSILPLDDASLPRGTAGSCGYPTSLYKVVNARDGFVYTLRRIDNVRSSHEACASVLQTWQQINHANVIPLREVFLQQRALYLIHDFVPGAKTLGQFVAERHNRLLPEQTLWSICTQILTAIRAVHDTDNACRGIIPSRVLFTGRFRVKLSCAGVMHAIEFGNMKSGKEHQQEDLIGLAKVILMLGCMSMQALPNIQKSIEFLRTRYSPELVKLVLLPFQEQCNVYDLLALASQGLLSEIDSLYSHSDAVEELLSRQFESDRISRLLIKLGMINERPGRGESNADSWSETGDRYIVKLFRDYVFHQTNDMGQPWLDIGHVISCLNKLDIGSPEKILLTGRHGRSFLVVSYQDVRRCVEESFQELLMSGQQQQESAHLQY